LLNADQCAELDGLQLDRPWLGP